MCALKHRLVRPGFATATWRWIYVKGDKTCTPDDPSEA
jgi:hypothetical protein